MMKTLIFLAACLAISPAAFGQKFRVAHQAHQLTKCEIGTTNIPGRRNPVIQDRAPGDIIISDDFSNAANWSTPADANGYQFDILSSTPSDMTNFIGTMASTTNTNGFAVFNGVTLLLNASTTPFGTQDAILEFNTSINCAGLSGVILEFEQRYRRFVSDSCFLEVSNDNFATYQTWHLNDDIAQNTPTAIQETEIVNISAIAGNQSNVKIRFRWKGGDDQSFGAGYGWFIDDLKLIESAHYDAAIEFASFNSNDLEYYKVPTSQLTGIEFSGEVFNNGDSIHTGLHLVTTVDKNGLVYTGTSSSVNLPPFQRDTLVATTQFTPNSGLGMYDITWTFVGNNPEDTILGNDTLVDAIEVTNSIYARDNDNQTGTITNFSNNSGLPFKIGNLMEIFNPGYINDIEIKVDNDQNNVGEIIYGSIYRFDGVNFTEIAITNDHVLTVSDIGTFVNFQFNSPIVVQPGDQLLVCAGHYGGQNDARFCMAQPTSFGSVLGVDATGQLAFLTNPSAMMVRIGVTESITVDQTVTICDGNSYNIGASTYNVAGLYTDSLTSVITGNDSIVNTDLIVMQPYNDTLDVFVCFGETYTVGGSVYSIAGTYTDSLQMVGTGCDSVITTNLTVGQPLNTNVVANQFNLYAAITNATYQWVDCDAGFQPINGATSQFFSPVVDGNYAVIITLNGCSQTSACYPIIGLGIEAYEDQIFSIYPNPAQNTISISLSDSEINLLSVKIVNNLGEIVFENQPVGDQQYQIDVSDLPYGAYYIELLSDSKKYVEKLLISR